LSEAILGSQASLTITAEVKNLVADPDDLLAMYRTDLANLFKMPVLGGVKLNHEMNSIFATTTKYIEIGNYVMKGEQGADALVRLLDGTIDDLRERLRKYKR
jgi:ribosome-associated translation inhibitor RaiA